MKTTMVRRDTTAGVSKNILETTAASKLSVQAESAIQAASSGVKTEFSLEKDLAPPINTFPETVAQNGGTASFFGVTSPAQEIVYVIDFSTSMKDSFEAVRRELLRSIGRLDERQKFHIIMFADNRPVEARGGKLISASRAAKSEVADFLTTVQPAGKTDPIPALSRAFAVLGSDRGDKVICILTDGVFPDSAEVIRAIKTDNAKGGVCVNTYLFGNNQPAANTLRQIAEQNGGTFVTVTLHR